MYVVDNPVKNMFLSVYNVQKAERFFITPWDLDSTFGRTYDGSYLNKYAFTGEVLSLMYYLNVYLKKNLVTLKNV